ILSPILSPLILSPILSPLILSPLIMLAPILSPLILSLAGFAGEPQPTIARLTPRPTTPATISEKIVRMLRLSFASWDVIAAAPTTARAVQADRSRALARSSTFRWMSEATGGYRQFGKGSAGRHIRKSGPCGPGE